MKTIMSRSRARAQRAPTTNLIIRQIHNNLWAPIKPTLYVRVYPLVHSTAAAEINDFDGAAAGVAQQNVFGFHVAVNLGM